MARHMLSGVFSYEKGSFICTHIFLAIMLLSVWCPTHVSFYLFNQNNFFIIAVPANFLQCLLCPWSGSTSKEKMVYTWFTKRWHLSSTKHPYTCISWCPSMKLCLLTAFILPQRRTFSLDVSSHILVSWIRLRTENCSILMRCTRIITSFPFGLMWLSNTNSKVLALSPLRTLNRWGLSTFSRFSFEWNMI